MYTPVLRKYTVAVQRGCKFSTARVFLFLADNAAIQFTNMQKIQWYLCAETAIGLLVHCIPVPVRRGSNSSKGAIAVDPSSMMIPQPTRSPRAGQMLPLLPRRQDSTIRQVFNLTGGRNLFNTFLVRTLFSLIRTLCWPPRRSVPAAVCREDVHRRVVDNAPP